jgi:hypothetical protein
VAFHNIFRKILFGISHNVPGIRRFASPNKQTEGLQGLQTVGGVLRGNGVSHDLATRNPEPPTGGEAYTVCYMPLFRTS